MKVLPVLAVIAVAGVGYHYWDKNKADDVVPSPNGFVPVAMPDDSRPNTVIILAPLNCPSDAAQRAESLSERLTSSGIPNVRSDSFTSSDADQQRVDRTLKVLNGEIPAVFVNGMAQSNPTAEQVVAEFRRTRQE